MSPKEVDGLEYLACHIRIYIIGHDFLEDLLPRDWLLLSLLILIIIMILLIIIKIIILILFDLLLLQ